eukprot:m.88257 g.88257  ORF g.88257 m.88257 type:complete len:331 (-) comp26171_c2_seq2:314-1306(-)
MEKFTTVLGYASRIQEKLIGLPFVGKTFNVLLCCVAVGLRCFAGVIAVGNLDKCKRPVKPIILYEYEGCPFCKKVRENVSALALDVEIRPTPRETLAEYGVCDKSRFRPESRDHPGSGGKVQFPYMVDEDAGVAMHDSDAIIAHLWKHYGDQATVPWDLYLANLAFLAKPCLFISTFVRIVPNMGFLRTPSKRPAKLLELYNMEGSPFCKLVRETLCTLEIPYILHNVPHGATKQRQAFFARCRKDLEVDGVTGKVRASMNVGKFPWLIDPNTNTSMGESFHIVSYLKKEYKTGELDVAAGRWESYSTKGATASHGTANDMLGVPNDKST